METMSDEEIETLHRLWDAASSHWTTVEYAIARRALKEAVALRASLDEIGIMLSGMTGVPAAAVVGLVVSLRARHAATERDLATRVADGSAARASLAAMTERCEGLRTLNFEECVRGLRCTECGQWWDGATESHSPTCIAAPLPADEKGTP
jgi:hypothetical protein